MYCRFCRAEFFPWEDINPKGDMRRCRACEGRHYDIEDPRYCRVCGGDIPRFPKAMPDGRTVMITGSRDLCPDCNPYSKERHQERQKKFKYIRERISVMAETMDDELKVALADELDSLLSELEKYG